MTLLLNARIFAKGLSLLALGTMALSVEGQAQAQEQQAQEVNVEAQDKACGQAVDTLRAELNKEVDKVAKKMGAGLANSFSSMRSACAAFRTCSTKCRKTKQSCKAEAKSEKHACMAECAKKSGRDKRKCKRACRRDKRSERAECRQDKRSCKDTCRDEFKSGACASARMKFWTQVTGAKKAAKRPGAKKPHTQVNNVCGSVYR